jgi:hypothetical protein
MAIERSGKRESTVGLHRLPTLLALASGQKWRPNLGPAAIRGKMVPVRKPSMVAASSETDIANAAANTEELNKLPDLASNTLLKKN